MEIRATVAIGFRLRDSSGNAARITASQRAVSSPIFISTPFHLIFLRTKSLVLLDRDGLSGALIALLCIVNSVIPVEIVALDQI